MAVTAVVALATAVVALYVDITKDEEPPVAPPTIINITIEQNGDGEITIPIDPDFLNDDGTDICDTCRIKIEAADCLENCDGYDRDATNDGLQTNILEVYTPRLRYPPGSRLLHSDHTTSMFDGMPLSGWWLNVSEFCSTFSTYLCAFNYVLFPSKGYSSFNGSPAQTLGWIVICTRTLVGSWDAPFCSCSLELFRLTTVATFSKLLGPFCFTRSEFPGRIIE